MPQSRAWQAISSEVDLPRGVGAWVFLAHLLTILSPAVLVAAAAAWWPAVEARLHWPVLLFPAALLLVIGSVCEAAENTQRRWYLVEQLPSFLDWLFNSCIAGFMVLAVIACRGELWWLTALVLALWVAFVAGYALDWPIEPLQGAIGMVYVLTLYVAFNDPVVFLQLLGVFFTIYFYRLLLATRAQSLHGFTALVNGLGLMALPWAIYNAAIGVRLDWAVVVGTVVSLVGLALLARPLLLKLSPTPRSSP